MKEIKLTQGKTALVDDEDYNIANQYRWYADKHGNTYYARRDIVENGVKTRIYMHSFILGTPKGKETDHINHNGIDNRKVNMRICTHAENARNTKPFGNDSRYLGVSYKKDGYRKKPWRATIKIGGEQKSLGVHETEEDAARAYDIKAKELFGEFANLNFKTTL